MPGVFITASTLQIILTLLEDSMASRNEAAGVPWPTDRMLNLHSLLLKSKKAPDIEKELDQETRDVIAQIISGAAQLPMQPTAEDMGNMVWPSPHARYPASVRRQLYAASEDTSYNCMILQNITDNHALSVLFFFLVEESGLIHQLKLDAVKLKTFAMHLENMHDSSRPYHNSAHVTGVLLSMYHILNGGVLDYLVNVNRGIVFLACLIAAAAHDCDHPGVTNSFLTQTQDRLAVRFNDQSVCEHHHLSRCFELLQYNTTDFLSGLDKSSYMFVRYLIINMVLKTDMQYHRQVLHAFQESVAAGETIPTINVLQMAIKCADLSHSMYPWPLHKTWTELLEREYFLQGDKELALGMPVTPLMDRSKQALRSSQSGFLSVVVHPLFHAFAGVFPDCHFLVRGLENNIKRWNEG